MTKLRTLLLIAVFILTYMTGCGARDARQAQAKKALENKYGETFEITKVYDNNSVKSQFNAIAHSASRPWIQIYARVENDGSHVEDDYLEKIIGERIADEIKRNVGALNGTYYIYVSTLSGGMGISDTSISIADYAAFNPKNKFTISMYYAPQEYDADIMYDKLSESLHGLEALNGYFFVHVIDEKNLYNMKEYLQTHAFFDKDEYEPYLKDELKIQIPYSNGRLDMTRGEFIEKAGGMI